MCMMTSSDIEVLIEMGFEDDRAQLAVKSTSSLQDAIDWLSQNQDTSINEIDVKGHTLNIEQNTESANSLVCNVCGKKFRNTGQAEFHASRTGHTDFSESTEKIASLSEEQKKEKLQELEQKRMHKKAEIDAQNNQDRKKNEQIRRKAMKESQDVREELERKERIKEAEAKRKEKIADLRARQNVLEKIQEDKINRKLKAEREKVSRAAASVSSETSLPIEPPSGPTLAIPGTIPKDCTETRLKVTTKTGQFVETFAVHATISTVLDTISQKAGIVITELVQNYTRRVFSSVDLEMTLKEAGLVPSAALNAR